MYQYFTCEALARVFRSFLSWRYLKSRRTNWIGIIGLFVAVGALILILSIMTGFLEESRKAVRGTLADIVVREPHPVSSGGGGPVPARAEPALAAIREDPRVEAAAAHLVWGALITPRGRAGGAVLASSQFGQYAFVKLVGIDVKDELATTELRGFLTEAPRRGRPVADPDDPFAPPPGQRAGGRPSILLGEQLFATHRLQRGSLVSLLSAVRDPLSGEWEPTSREYTVAGTFRSSDNELDLERIYLDRTELAMFLAGVSRPEELPEGAVRYNEILVKVADYDAHGREVAGDLERRLVEAGLLSRRSEVATWEEHRRHLLGAIENERVMMGIMLSLVLLVAGFSIFAILSMMVTEKRRDIGILTAVGATPRGVMTMFLLIGFWDALIGGTLGAVAGAWAAVEIDAIERWLSRTFEVQIFNRDVYLFTHIPSVVEPWRVALIVLGAFACALVFAAIPAWKAASLDPLDALRYE